MKKLPPSCSYSLLLVVLLLVSSCQVKESITPGEGYIDVTGGKVWYKIVGSGRKTPIILLHGGPGAPSYYLNPLAALSEDRPVIFYDQLGCGRSDREIDTTLMTVERYVEEVKQVRDALGLKEYYLYGHSWGTMLGIEFYLTYPNGIKGIIFGSPAISIPMWLRDADSLITTMPDSIQNAIRKHEENKAYDSPEYLEAVGAYYSKFLTRKGADSEDMKNTNDGMGQAYQYMWGPSEFTATGQLKDFDRSDRLSEIKVPTLFIAGEFDEAVPSTVQYYQRLVLGATFAMIPGAAHLTMQDNSAENVKVIREFLREIESD